MMQKDKDANAIYMEEPCLYGNICILHRSDLWTAYYRIDITIACVDMIKEFETNHAYMDVFIGKWKYTLCYAMPSQKFVNTATLLQKYILYINHSINFIVLTLRGYTSTKYSQFLLSLSRLFISWFCLKKSSGTTCTLMSILLSCWKKKSS